METSEESIFKSNDDDKVENDENKTLNGDIESTKPKDSPAVFFNIDLKKSKGISVVLRVRPLNESEISRKEKSIVDFPGAGQVQLKSQNINKTFSFNVCFEPEAEQDMIFEHSGVKKLTELASDGYLATCFVYGQTGSGKTFTMTGPTHEFLNKSSVNASLYGIAPRSFFYLFELLKNQENYRVYASYLEIYNEQVKDLLNPHPLYPLNVRWNKRRCFYVDNLFLIECESAEQLLEVLQRGMKNRNFKATNPNEYSSRSHSIFSVMIDSEVIDPVDESVIYTKHGKLTFVDLAGSEKVKTDSDPSQNQLQETNNINRSLMVLGNCISWLSDSKKRNSYIPFRDSKLTKLLADSLSGNGFTIMIACISPSSSSVTDTANTLRYAARALKIETNPRLKMDPNAQIIANLKREIHLLRQENLLLKSQMLPNYVRDPSRHDSEIQSDNSIKSSEPLQIETFSTQNSLHFGSEKQPPNIYEMLQEYMVENENLRSQNLELIQFKERFSREHQILIRENEKMTSKIEEMKQQKSSRTQTQITNKETTLLSNRSTISTNTSISNVTKTSPRKPTDNKRKRNSMNVSLSDLTVAETSYAKLFDSRKKSYSQTLGTPRNYNDGTKLKPLKNPSNIPRLADRQNLEFDLNKLDQKIKLEMNQFNNRFNYK